MTLPGPDGLVKDGAGAGDGEKFFSFAGGWSYAAAGMTVTDRRSPRLTLDARSPGRSQASSTPDEEPFGAALGALVGILISVPLWVLIAVVVLLLRRL